MLAGETENQSHVPRVRPYLSVGENVSSEFDFMVIFPPTWFLFAVGVTAPLPTHLYICMKMVVSSFFFRRFFLCGKLRNVMNRQFPQPQ